MDLSKRKLKSIGNYILLSRIGKGAFASVYSGLNQNTNEIVAIKQIEMSKIKSSKETFKNEFFILSKINHNNIIKLIDYERTSNNIYFILDYCNGGNLSEYVKYYEKKEGKLLNENDIQKLLRQLILGLEYMHKNNIIHRDLKLENILLNFNDIKTEYNLDKKIQKVDYSKVSLNDSFTLKIADLGFSKNIAKESYASTFLGTPITISPDILLGNGNERKYNTKTDLWSLGVITYQLLIGYPPFNSDDNIFQIFQKIKYGKYKIPTNIKISVEAISFINGLLQFYPEKRFNWEQIKSHPFITHNVENFHYIDLKTIEYSNDIVIDTKNCDNLLWVNFDTKLNIGLDKIDQKFINEKIKNEDKINEENKEVEKKNNENNKNDNEEKKEEDKNNNLNNEDKINEENKEFEKKNDENNKNDNEEKKEEDKNNLNINNNNENFEVKKFNSGVVIDYLNKNEENNINIISSWIDLDNNDKDEINSINYDLDYEVEDTFENLDIDENYINNYLKIK